MAARLQRKRASFVCYMVTISFLLNVVIVKSVPIDPVLLLREDSFKTPPKAPTWVYVGFLIKDMYDIDSHEMQFKLTYVMYMEWEDRRIRLNNTTSHTSFPAHESSTELSPESKERIFIPDISIRNEKERKETPNLRIMITPSGHVTYMHEITSTIRCQMYLQDFPLDIQKCFLELESFRYDVTMLQLDWMNKLPLAKWRNGPIVYYKGKLELDSWHQAETSLANCTDVTCPEIKSCLKIEFQLKRKYEYFVFQIYLPQVLLVSVAWVSFWFNMDPGDKVSLLLTDILSIVVISHELNESLPPVCYLKAIDLWNFVCLAFTVACLLEVCIVAYTRDIVLTKNRKHFWNCLQRSRGQQELPATEPEAVRSDTNQYILVQGRDKKKCSGHENQVTDSNEAKKHCVQANQPKSDTAAKEATRLKTHKLDIISRVMFPVAFALFNMIYWAYYLS